jgi:hypothetical protein
LQDAWHIVKWVWVAVWCVYMTVQISAVRRLKGDLKKRSTAVLTVIVVLMGVSDAVRNIFFFEDRVADRIGMLIVGSAAFVASIYLVGLFGQTEVNEAGSKGSAEDHIQPLRLN